MPQGENVERERSIEALIREHRKRKGEQLHLAVQFADPRHPKDVVLFEVFGGFGGGRIDPDKRFVEMALGESAIPLRPGGQLRFVLTSPEELREASSKGWRALAKLKKHDLVEVLYADSTGKALRPLLDSE